MENENITRISNIGCESAGNDRPKVSVLVPVYNVEQLLGRCLDSLLGQTLEDIEILCVNDCSPDGSADILKAYSERDKRVRVIEKPENEGLMMARVTGYRHGRGEYFFFCDSDDYIPADALEKLYAKAKATNADITVGGMYIVNGEGAKVLRPREDVACGDGSGYLYRILGGATCSLCGSLYKRSLFEGHVYPALKRHSFSEDRILLTRLLLDRRPSVATIPDDTYYYWVNTESITRRKISKQALCEQLKALFLCHGMVSESVPESDSDMLRANDAFMVRAMSYYLEQVPWRSLIREFNEDSHRLLGWSGMRACVPAHLAVHTWFLLHLPPYRHIAWRGRMLIRKMQGKV